MDYDCKIEAAKRLAGNIRKWIPEINGTKVGFFSDNEDKTILNGYRSAGIKDITVARDPYELFDQVFDIVGISCVNYQPDEALYFVYDLFRQRRFNGRALLCTNFIGQSMNGYLEKRVEEVLNQDSVQGYFMDNPEADSILKNIRVFPLTSTLIFCSRPDHKLVWDILDVDYELDKEPELNLPSATQVTQQVQVDMSGRTTRARAIQCSVKQGEQLIYAAFSDRILPYTVQDVSSFVYQDSSVGLYWDIFLIDDCSELVKKVKPLIKGKDPKGGYVLNGSGRGYSKNLRDFSEFAIEYDNKLKKMFSLIMMLEERGDITLPLIGLKDAKGLLQEGVSPQTILGKYRGINAGEMESLAAKFYRKEQVVVTTNSRQKNNDDGNRGKEDGSIVKAREIISRGVVLYDSDLRRLYKNASRVHGVAQLKTTSKIKPFPGVPSLESYKKHGVYVLNSFDDKCREALMSLLNLYIDSDETLYLAFLGEDFNESDISDAKQLGVNVRFTSIPILQGHISEKQPVNLEEVIASML